MKYWYKFIVKGLSIFSSALSYLKSIAGRIFSKIHAFGVRQICRNSALAYTQFFGYVLYTVTLLMQIIDLYGHIAFIRSGINENLPDFLLRNAEQCSDFFNAAFGIVSLDNIFRLQMITPFRFVLR